MPCNETRQKGMIGFAMKAGKLVLGTDSVCEALRERGAGKPLLVLIASDVSDNTRDKIQRKCTYYEIPTVSLFFSMDEIGTLLGKPHGVAALGVTDGRFAKEIADASGDGETPTKGSSREGTR